MKKYFLILAALTAGLFVSCNNGGDIGPDEPKPINPTTVTISDPIYYGQKIGDNTGYYTMTFTKGDDKLRLDLLSAVAADPTKAKPLAGTYKLGTREEATSQTYFVAKQNEDTEGTLFWDNGTPVFVTGGTVLVQIGTGNTYTVTLNLTAGDTTIDWKYSGNIVFENKAVKPIRKPRTGDQYMIDWQGEYFLANTKMGMLRFAMTSVEEPNVVFQFWMTVPYPEDLDNITIPTGTFSVEKDPQEPYKIMEGYVDGGRFIYSYEAEVSDNGLARSMLLITGGEATISTEGGKFSITTNMNGNICNPSNGAVIGTEEGIVYNLQTESVPPIMDMSKPLSTLENDVELSTEEFPNVFIMPLYMDKDETIIFWRMVFSTKDLTIKESPDFDQTNNLLINGEGRFLGIQFITPKGVVDPNGTFKFSETYPDPSAQIAVDPGDALPGARLASLDMLANLSGTWYAEVEIVDGSLVAVVNAGAMAGMGSINIDLNDATKTMTVVIDMSDRYNNKVSGTLNYQFSTEASLQAVAEGLPSTIRTMTANAPVSNFTRYSLPLF